jgi:pimeloyl-ACP methyl ester carboxylesterase
VAGIVIVDDLHDVESKTPASEFDGIAELFTDLVTSPSNDKNEDCIESLRQLRAPVVSINAALTPTNVDAFRKHVPSFLVKIIPDPGHLLMWDAPEEFNRLLAKSIEELVNWPHAS